MGERTYTAKQKRMFRAVFKTIAPVYDALTFGAFSKIYNAYFRDSITDRLKKIDEAKAALTEALSAIEDLQVEAENNSEALNQLVAKLEVANEQKTLVW